jgi:hypothetical protein
MRISSLVVCDFAQVREGLLTICSGGITRVAVPEVPAPLGVMLAALLELGPGDMGPIHEVTWRVSHVEVAATVANGLGAVQVTQAPGHEPGEPVQIPLLVDLRHVAVSSLGQHDIKVTVDGAPDMEVRSLWVVSRPPQDA